MQQKRLYALSDYPEFFGQRSQTFVYVSSCPYNGEVQFEKWSKTREGRPWGFENCLHLSFSVSRKPHKSRTQKVVIFWQILEDRDWRLITVKSAVMVQEATMNWEIWQKEKDTLCIGKLIKARMKRDPHKKHIWTKTNYSNWKFDLPSSIIFWIRAI